MARTEFRFVLDGIDLEDPDRERIARAVQEAGMKAVAGLHLEESIVAVDIGAIGRKWEWIGRVALAGELAERALPQFEKFVAAER